MTTPLTPPTIPLAPIQDYGDAVRFLDGLDVSAMKLGLSRVEKLLATLGNPQDDLPIVHVAGTNGKGSVTAMLSAILRASGYATGSFTSPHLVHVRERIAINGNPILPDDFQFEVNALKTRLESLNWPRDEWPTYFEFLNVLAYQYFKRKGVEMAVFETGLGGRLDSTNVVKHPHLTVITGIGLDHTQHLGDTLAQIAAEKAGILKAGSPLILGDALPSEAESVVLEKARALEIPVFTAQADALEIDQVDSSPESGQVIRHAESGQRYRLSLLGPYQKQNLATVLACVQQLRLQGYRISEEAVQTGLSHTYWPVRFQFMSAQNLLLDGSHNTDGFNALNEGLHFYFAQRTPIWLLSLRTNRDAQLLANLVNRFNPPAGIIVTQAEPHRLYHSPDSLAKTLRQVVPLECPVLTAETPTEALHLLQGLLSEQAVSKPLGVVTGSLYTAGAILHALKHTAPAPKAQT